MIFWDYHELITKTFVTFEIFTMFYKHLLLFKQPHEYKPLISLTQQKPLLWNFMILSYFTPSIVRKMLKLVFEPLELCFFTKHIL